MADYKLLAVLSTGKPGVPNASNFGAIPKLKVTDTLDVTNNITVGGTVDGVDIATRDGVLGTLDTNFSTHDGGTAKAQHSAIGDHTHASAGAEGGTIDHGDTTGKGDDDHTQYSKADGTRAFSGVVSGVTPTSDGHLATKGYTDSVAAGMKAIGSVVARTTGNVNISAPGATIDGVTMSVDDRVLVDQQSTGSEDGFYLWKGAATPMVRTDDFPTGKAAAGTYTFVEEGNTYADVGVVCTNDGGADIVGTHDLVFTQFSAPGSYTGGDGVDITTMTIKVDLGADPGLEFVSNKLEVKANTTAGLEKTASGVGVNLEASNPSLAVVSTELGVKINTAAALEKGASGLGINIEASSPSLQFASNELGLKIYASGGLQKDANGTSLKLDDTPDTLDVDGDGLKVVGLPSLFKINGTAVGSDVTAVNLDELTDGSSSVTLHTHDLASHAIGGGSHTSSTLANLNSKISDLIATYGGIRDIGQGTDAQRPSAGTASRMWWSTDADTLSYDNGATWDEIIAVAGAHDFEGSSHTACTLAELNAANTISDADLIADDDSRLSDDRDPNAHSSDHKHGGGDEVATATPGANAIPKADASNKLAAGWIQEVLAYADLTDDPLGTHEAAGDPHTGYRLESADHSHESTGAEAGKIDHGLALDGLGDDDHSQYHNDARALTWHDADDHSGLVDDNLTWSGTNHYNGDVTVDQLVGDGDYVGLQIAGTVGTGGITIGDILTFDASGGIIRRDGPDKIAIGIATSTTAATSTGYYLPIGVGKALFTTGDEPLNAGDNVFTDNTSGNYHKLTTDVQTDGIVYSAIAIESGALAQVIWLARRIFSFE